MADYAIPQVPPMRGFCGPEQETERNRTDMSTLCAKTLKDSLDDVVELRPFPAAASQLMVACEKADVTAREITGIIKHDPGLSVKLLQIANSPLYGFAGEIRSVDHATVVLGMRALRDLAISTAVGGVFGSGDKATAQARSELWLHSLACGSVARMLARTLRMESPDEAFLGGIVHDVGKLFFYDAQPLEYYRLTTSTSRTGAVHAEREFFGIDHTFAGQKCGQNWGLPEEINDVICFHHAPADADFGGELIDVVAAANKLCHLWNAKPDDCVSATSEILKAVRIDLSPDETVEFQTQALADIQIICEAYVG